MIIDVLGIFESLIFLILAGVHFNWAFGGKWGFKKALPTDKQGRRVLNPKKQDSAVVGFGLLIFATYYIIQQVNINALPPLVLTYGGWIISLIFLLRAIGDFKYIGFFKRIKNTEFAKLDTKYYAPLCLIVGLIAIILAI